MEGRGDPFTLRELDLIDELMAPPAMELRPLLRWQIQEGEAEVITLTRGQLHLLDMLRGRRRAAIVGPAGTSKTMLAAEKARRLAREGFRTLLVCFKQPLARMLAEELATVATPGGLDVLTFHELCLRLGREAGTLPAVEPVEKDQDWFDVVLPAALDAAIPKIGGRYHAIVVDEGQDFALGWLESLFYLLVDPESDVFYVFHDPAEGLPRGRVREPRPARVRAGPELPQPRADPRAGRPLSRRGRSGHGDARERSRAGDDPEMRYSICSLRNRRPTTARWISQVLGESARPVGPAWRRSCKERPGRFAQETRRRRWEWIPNVPRGYSRPGSGAVGFSESREACTCPCPLRQGQAHGPQRIHGPWPPRSSPRATSRDGAPLSTGT